MQKTFSNFDCRKLMRLHGNANRDVRENARCNAAMQIKPG
jgi:hypothetical protein